MNKISSTTPNVLTVTPRYVLHSMQKAMGGKIERALVELITNADDSYKELEKEGYDSVGRIFIEIARKRNETTTIKVRDYAQGMSREKMGEKLSVLGARSSGTGRGLMGRGAKDVVAFGDVTFASIKNDKYNFMEIKYDNVLSPDFKLEQNMDDKLRLMTKIPENGTIVTMYVKSTFKVPNHDSLVESFAKYYSLRDIFSNPKREVIILDSNSKKQSKLVYEYPQGEIIFNESITLDDYDEERVFLTIKKHNCPFDRDNLPTREGILVKTPKAIYDCTYFGLESEPDAWKFSGILNAEIIDRLAKEWDDEEEKKIGHTVRNPIFLVDPDRDGLAPNHPFKKLLWAKCREILSQQIQKYKSNTSLNKVSNDDLNNRLSDLSKNISNLFEKTVEELEDDLEPGEVSDGTIFALPIGLHIIPPGKQYISAGRPKTFTVILVDKNEINDPGELLLDCQSSNISICNQKKLIPVPFDKARAKSTFKLISTEIGASAEITAKYKDYSTSIIINVREEPDLKEIQPGLSFDNKTYCAKPNKEKKLVLRFKPREISDFSKKIYTCKVSSDNSKINIKYGNVHALNYSSELDCFVSNIIIVGQQINSRAKITASVEGYDDAMAAVTVKESERSGINFEFDPVEEDFSPVRYKWENSYQLKIGAKHPSVRRYLGELVESVYENIDSPLYHAVLAEIIAEALAFEILGRQFKIKGEEGSLDFEATDLYFHQNFSKFLKITHKYLVSEN